MNWNLLLVILPLVLLTIFCLGSFLACSPFSAAADPDTALVPPTILTAMAVDSNTVYLAWISTSPGAVNFLVQRGLPGQPLNQVGQTSLTNFTDTSLTEGTTYLYKISATISGGSPADSPIASVTTLPAARLISFRLR
jgi:hypothetical protein